MNLFRRRNVESNTAITGSLILDGTSFAGGANGGPVRPPDQLQVLDRYGAFCRREKIPLTVIFVGKPLRELDADGRYRGEIPVLYADSIERLPELLRKAIKSAPRSAAVVATGSPELAGLAGSMGATVMRETTLRKVVERMPGERGSNGRQSRNRGGGSGSQKKPQVSKPDQASNGNKRDSAASSGGDINDLIDLV